MKKNQLADCNEPSPEFVRIWNLAREYAQTRDEIGLIIKQEQTIQKRRNIRFVLSIAASLLLCGGLIGVFKPFGIFDSHSGLADRGKSEPSLEIPVFPEEFPEYKASTDVYSNRSGIMLRWKSDSLNSQRVELEFHIPGGYQIIYR